MSLSINIRFCSDKKTKPWRAQWSENGKRVSKYFPSEKDARAFRKRKISEADTFGKTATSEEDRMLLWQIKRHCEAEGISPMEVIAAGLRAAKPQKEKESPSLNEAARMFIDDCHARNLRMKTIRGYRDVLNAFAGRSNNQSGDMSISGFKRQALLLWIVEQSPNEESRKGYRSVLRNFFNWCSHQNRGWCSADVAKNLTWRSVANDEHRVGFLTPEQVEGFLDNIQGNCRAAIALACFAGIRTEELQRMQWAEKQEGRFYGIDFENRQIHMKGEWTKTRRYRLLSDLPPNLWVWLWLYRKQEGPVVPINYRNYRRACLLARDAAKISDWPKNGFRHSFGTYAYFRGIEWAIDAMGHVGGYRTFVRSYKGASSASESAKYFGIIPALL
jgi:integrase